MHQGAGNADALLLAAGELVGAAVGLIFNADAAEGCQRALAVELSATLRQHGIALIDYTELDDEEQRALREHYFENIFPLVTPLALDPAHPFPFISNLSVSLGVIMQHPERDRTENLFARIKIPEMLPRWIRVGPQTGNAYRFVSLYDVIRNNLDDLFLKLALPCAG